jgi:hypothetical protein
LVILILSAAKVENFGGRAVNDTALIFDRRKLDCIKDQSLYDLHGTATLKCGHLSTFQLAADGSVLHVVVSHWPSRLYKGEPVEARRQLGLSLHRQLRPLATSNAHVVVMGDFNDDPFSPSLASSFFATRDRRLAIEKNHCFYNPFWRQLGESEHHGSRDEGICGTHFYESGQDSRWFTFDQIMFSSAFLTSATHLLNESSTSILQLPGLKELIESSDFIFDHFPVTGETLLRASS